MSTRKKIGLHMSVSDIVAEMAEGNPGALRVLMQIAQSGPAGVMDVLHFDDMGMRGEQIYAAFKDYAGSDLTKLKEAMKSRSMEMVNIVNRECPQWKAVPHGASFR